MGYPRFTQLYAAVARKNLTIISFFITVVITIILMRIDAELAGMGGKGVFYLQMAFTKNTFIDIVSSWRSGGLDLLAGTLWLSYIYAASYAFLFASATAYFSLLRKHDDAGAVATSDRVIFIVPWCAALLDWTVITLWWVLFSGRSLSEEIIFAASAAAAGKWILIAASLILLLRNYFAFRKQMKSAG